MHRCLKGLQLGTLLTGLYATQQSSFLLLIYILRDYRFTLVQAHAASTCCILACILAIREINWKQITKAFVTKFRCAPRKGLHRIGRQPAGDTFPPYDEPLLTAWKKPFEGSSSPSRKPPSGCISNWEWLRKPRLLMSRSGFTLPLANRIWIALLEFFTLFIFVLGASSLSLSANVAAIALQPTIILVFSSCKKRIVIYGDSTNWNSLYQIMPSAPKELFRILQGSGPNIFIRSSRSRILCTMGLSCALISMLVFFLSSTFLATNLSLPPSIQPFRYSSSDILSFSFVLSSFVLSAITHIVKETFYRACASQAVKRTQQSRSEFRLSDQHRINFESPHPDFILDQFYINIVQLFIGCLALPFANFQGSGSPEWSFEAALQHVHHGLLCLAGSAKGDNNLCSLSVFLLFSHSISSIFVAMVILWIAFRQQILAGIQELVASRAAWRCRVARQKQIQFRSTLHTSATAVTQSHALQSNKFDPSFFALCAHLSGLICTMAIMYCIELSSIVKRKDAARGDSGHRIANGYVFLAFLPGILGLLATQLQHRDTLKTGSVLAHSDAEIQASRSFFASADRDPITGSQTRTRYPRIRGSWQRPSAAYISSNFLLHSRVVPRWKFDRLSAAAISADGLLADIDSGTQNG